jgi:hypothetical protein
MAAPVPEIMDTQRNFSAGSPKPDRLNVKGQMKEQPLVFQVEGLSMRLINLAK